MNKQTMIINGKTTIAKEKNVATLINVFTVKPENQKQLVDMLAEATEKTMQHLPGFVSVNIHTSLDGTRVVNYVQWRTREDFQAMLKNPEAQVHMKAIANIAEFDAKLYDVAEIISK